MTIVEDIQTQVRELAAKYTLAEDRAFAYWYLEGFEDLSHEDALETVVDGPWDGGRDAVYEDEGASALRIYQFKYSEDKNYVIGGFSDLQRAVQAEQARVGRFSEVHLTLVTLIAADQDFVDIQKRVQRLARGWLTRHGITECEAIVEVIDLNRFAQLLDRIYGVPTTLTYKAQPTDFGDAVLGLADVRPLTPFVEAGALFAFNIRNFLGVRKKSVNSEMKTTLETARDRPNFWKMNNGIVCLCTDYSPAGEGRIAFENLTVVNGAQTTSTIARYLEDNPADDGPVWVMAKILKVGSDDVDTAIRLTKTSNRQTPASSKDLRAVDSLHRTLKEWFAEQCAVHYVYRRGDHGARGQPKVSMKELAQAYIAFSEELPHVAFARAGTIFTSEDLYEKVFPEDEISRLAQAGSVPDIQNFLASRLIPYKLLLGVRERISTKVTSGRLDKRWRSLTYHCVWAYRRVFDEEHIIVDATLLPKVDALLAATSSDVFDGLHDFFVTKGSEIPRALKSSAARDDLLSGSFTDISRIQDARAAIRGI